MHPYQYCLSRQTESPKFLSRLTPTQCSLGHQIPLFCLQISICTGPVACLHVYSRHSVGESVPASSLRRPSRSSVILHRPLSTIRACVSRLPILHYRDIAFRPVSFHPISPPSPPSQYALSIHHPLATIRPLCPLRAARICPRAPSSSSSSARSPCSNTHYPFIVHYPLSPIRTCVFRPRVKPEMTVPVRRARVNAASC
jgi:hypothetical protein